MAIYMYLTLEHTEVQCNIRDFQNVSKSSICSNSRYQVLFSDFSNVSGNKTIAVVLLASTFVSLTIAKLSVSIVSL